MNNAAHHTRLTTPADFERAFEITDRLLAYELRMKWLPDLITPGAANDTVAALRQARDLVLAIHAAGLELHDLHNWLVEWGRAWKEQEEITKLENEPAALAA